MIKPMKLLTIVGARPQFIKAAAVSRAISKWNGSHPTIQLQELIVHTGQHYDANMSEVFFREMQIPEPFLNLASGSGRHGAQTALMLQKLEDVFMKERPDVVLVYGDTNSTLAGALAASKLDIPVIHIEAGLRSYNKKMPEEQNRVLTDHLSTLLFCPTETARKNLCTEGFSDQLKRPISSDQPAVSVCGDVMYDCVLFYGELAEGRTEIFEKAQLGDGPDGFEPFVLATIHRQENTDCPDRLGGIVRALASIAEKIPVVVPLHPRTFKLLSHSMELRESVQSLRILEPISYLDMILLEKTSTLICTDSGGVQKEAFFFKKPCITMRDQTEWTETVEAGWNVITGADVGLIRRHVERALDWMVNRATAAPFQKQVEADSKLFGDGNSADIIVKEIVEWLG